MSVLPLGLEAEVVLAVHRAHHVPVEADVVRDRVDVAPVPLDPRGESSVRRRRPPRTAQGVHRLHRQAHGVGVVAPVADALLDRDQLPLGGAAPTSRVSRLRSSFAASRAAAASAMRDCTCANCAIGLPPPATAPRGAPADELDELVDRPLHHAERGRGDRHRHAGEERDAIDPVRVLTAPGGLLEEACSKVSMRCRARRASRAPRRSCCRCRRGRR